MSNKACYFILLLLFNSYINGNDIPLRKKIIKQTYYEKHRLYAVETKCCIGKKIYAPDKVHYAHPSYPYYYDLQPDTLDLGIDYYIINNSSANPVYLRVEKDTTLKYIKSVEHLDIWYNNKGHIEREKCDIREYKYYKRKNIIFNRIDSLHQTYSKKYVYYNDNNVNIDHIEYCDSLCLGDYWPFYEPKFPLINHVTYSFSENKNNESISQKVVYKYGRKYSKDKSYRYFISKVNYGFLSNSQPNSHSNYYCNIRNADLRSRFQIPQAYRPKLDSLTLFIDSDNNIVKRKTFYVPDDCSYGGYASTDSIFNRKGQLIIEKPGYHANGTKMAPYYTNAEFTYYENGEFKTIRTFGTDRDNYKYYNKKGQIIKIIENYDGDYYSTYEYDDYGNLILYTYNWHIGSDSVYYSNKYEHIYDEDSLLLETYQYHQHDNNYLITQLSNKQNLEKHLIAKYYYDQYKRILKKEEYNNNIRLGIDDFIYKSTTYEYYE